MVARTKVVLYGVMPAFVVVDTESKQVERFVVDDVQFVYEDPILAMDLEGGPVRDDLRFFAYDIAESGHPWPLAVFGSQEVLDGG